MDEAFATFCANEMEKNDYNWKYQGPIHEYFQQLSQSFGFLANESVSLFDLPQIMATPNKDQYESLMGTRQDQWESLGQTKNFIYTRKMLDKKINKGMIKKCKENWMNYVLKG